jgi:CRP-like cAMP-binding protein
LCFGFWFLVLRFKKGLAMLELILSAYSTVTRFKKDDILFLEGDFVDKFYFVVGGSVKIFKTDLSLRDFYLFSVVGGEFVNDMISFEAYEALNSAVCLEDCEVVVFDLVEFKELVFSNPAFMAAFLKLSMARSKKIDQVVSCSLMSLEKRVAMFLQEDLEGFNASPWIHVAMLLNAAPESLTRTIKKLVNDGVIEKVGYKTIEVLDVEKLESLVFA